jgi:uncharacterized protein with HEPN domain
MRRLPSEKQIQQFEDILDNIARVERFTAGFDADRFAQNEQAFYAVLLQISTIKGRSEP